MGKSIYLSPSTQERNIGAGDYSTEEMRMNQVVEVVANELVRHGVTVYRNRPEMTLSEVVKDSNLKSPDIHFAIHSNALNGKARGCEVFCHRYGGKGEELARLVYSKVSALTPIKDRGVKEGHSFFGEGKPMYELAKTYAPAALIEIAFHDNPEDAKWITDNIQDIGTAIAKGILEYFCVPYIEESENLEDAVGILGGKGFFNTPEYWLTNAVEGKTIDGGYAAILIKKMAIFIKNGGI